MPIASPHEYVPADTANISFLAANMKIDPVLSAGFAFSGRGDGLYSQSWPAVGADEGTRPASPKQVPGPASKVHDIILRYFAKQFVPMGRDELKWLQLADLETIL